MEIDLIWRLKSVNFDEQKFFYLNNYYYFCTSFMKKIKI